MKAGRTLSPAKFTAFMVECHDQDQPIIELRDFTGMVLAVDDTERAIRHA